MKNLALNKSISNSIKVSSATSVKKKTLLKKIKDNKILIFMCLPAIKWYLCQGHFKKES